MDYKKLTRREALKYLGTTVAGMTLASTGALSMFTSCTEKGKKRIVFYFTATGNSLYAAKKFSETPLSIPQILKGKNRVFEADEIGIVFPDYRAFAPLIVQKFIQEVPLKASYLFSVITFGNYDCNVIESWNQFAIEHGVHFNYITTIKMVDNYLPVFDMDEQLKMDKQEESQLEQAVADVLEEKNHIPSLTEEERQQCLRVLQRVPELFPISSELLLEVNKSSCNGCGICTKVCPRKNFSLTDKGVEHTGDCEFCLACIQNCPQKAIVLKRGERNKEARYRHPRISLNEIVLANKQ